MIQSVGPQGRGRVWLITGASRGLGHGIARAAIDHGERVIVTARDPSKLEELVSAAPERVGTQAQARTHAASSDGSRRSRWWLSAS